MTTALDADPEKEPEKPPIYAPVLLKLPLNEILAIFTQLSMAQEEPDPINDPMRELAAEDVVYVLSKEQVLSITVFLMVIPVE